MFHVLATVFEPEGKDREPNQESSIIQKARAVARVASWNRGHDPKFSSAGTERDSIHHCEEYWLPSTTQKNCKENCLWTQNIPDVLQQGIWLKNYVLPSSKNSKKPYWGSASCTERPCLAFVVQLLSRVWLPVTLWTSVCQAALSITVSWSLLKLIPLSCWYHPTIPSSVMPSAPAFNISQDQDFCLFVCFVVCLLPSELTLLIRRPKHWSFSISSSTEYSGLIFLRIDWLDLLEAQGTLKSLLHSPALQLEKISSSALSLLYGGALPSASNYWEKHSFDFTGIGWQSNDSVF